MMKNVEQTNGTTTIASEAKWFKYLNAALVAFAYMFFEIVSIFTFERLLFGRFIWDYTFQQMGFHYLIAAVFWAVAVYLLVSFTRKKYNYPVIEKNEKAITAKEWILTLLCLLGSKIITIIDWHTLKVIGEFQLKPTIFNFAAQYIYYLGEMACVGLIVIYGQKAFEVLLKRKSNIPFGGFILAVTWGAMHFVSRFQGVEIWNGVSCIIFSLLCGISYLAMNRRISFLYGFLIIGYLL